jgi:hypothetical protein
MERSAALLDGAGAATLRRDSRETTFCRMTSASTPLPGDAPPASALLSERLEGLRRQHVQVAALSGLALSIVVGLEILALAMFIDWWLELPWAIRGGSLFAQTGWLTWLLTNQVLIPLVRQPDQDELALMMEKARSEFRGRLIAAVQLARPGAVPPSASTSLVNALVEETESLARPVDFASIVPTERLRKFGAMAVVVAVLALAGFLAARGTCTVLLKRVFLSHEPVPRKTRILVPEGSRIVGLGDSVRLEAFVQGIVPSQGRVEVKYRNRRAQDFPLEQNRAQRANFGRTLENVQDSFGYRFSIGDGVSEWFNITAIPRPTVLAIECQQEFPAYTGLKTANRSLGDLTLLAGSVLRLKATATKDLQSAVLKLVGVDQESALAIGANHARELAGQFTVPARGLTGFQIQMLDTENMESRDGATYRVDVLPDKVPTARITHPDRKEELITRQATMLIGFEAADDFEIAKVRLKFKVDTIDNGAEKTMELDLEGQRPQRLRRRHEWKVAETLPGVGEGSVIEYWFEVEDNNNATGPGVGSTEHQLAKVVSEGEKRADLLNRAGDYLGSISDVAADQERLNRALGATIRAKAGLR